MKHILAFLIPTLLLIINCKDSDNPVNQGDGGDKITTGEVVNLTTESIGIGGGTIKVSKPGDPLDGLEITIPADAFNSINSFNISYAEIKSHAYGQYFNPITPLIKITHDGQYSDHPILVKIPIKLPQGKFAMGFLYNHKTGEIEGIPISDLDSNYITVVSRHFTSRSSLLKKINISNDILGDLVVGAIDESVLNNQTIIQTGFDPGEDDWEYINRGSYLSSYGICAGQTLTAMWYYLEKTKKGAGQTLFHRYDQINNKLKPKLLWQDNPRGYRFASVVQSDCDWHKQIVQWKLQIGNPLLTWKAFALSMLLTGEPQYVAVKGTEGGHALTAYKMDYPGGKLYVADPNYPGNINKETGGSIIREIVFQNGKFERFFASLNAITNPYAYDSVYYYGKTSFIDWPKLNSRWVEFEAGTIGNDKFPKYSLRINGPDGYELTDGKIVEYSELRVVCKSTDCGQFLPGTDHLQRLEVFNETGDSLSVGNDPNFGMTSVNLKPGKNKLGFFICGRIDDEDVFVDFKWINVYYYTLSIDPNSLIGEVNKPYTFTARVSGIAPANAKYEWNFDDETPSVIKVQDSTATHTFTQAGQFTVSAKLYDNSNGELLAIASTEAIISSASDSLNLLHKSYTITIKFNADMTFNPPNLSISPLHITSDSYYRGGYKLVWSGTSFSVNYNYKIPGLNGDTTYVTGTQNGTVTIDGKTILTLKANEQKITTIGNILNQSIEIKNVPFKSFGDYAINAEVKGPSVKDNITALALYRKSWINSSQSWEEVSLVSVDYFSSYQPNLWISFEKNK